jgi:hypothetical protein
MGNILFNGVFLSSDEMENVRLSLIWWSLNSERWRSAVVDAPQQHHHPGNFNVESIEAHG